MESQYLLIQDCQHPNQNNTFTSNKKKPINHSTRNHKTSNSTPKTTLTQPSLHFFRPTLIKNLITTQTSHSKILFRSNQSKPSSNFISNNTFTFIFQSPSQKQLRLLLTLNPKDFRKQILSFFIIINNSWKQTNKIRRIITRLLKINNCETIIPSQIIGVFSKRFELNSHFQIHTTNKVAKNTSIKIIAIQTI